MRISDWSSDVCSSDLIIGLCRENRSTKLLFENDSVRECSEISPYLVPGQRVIVKPRERTISPIAVMAMGSNPVDGKRLILEKSEADVIVKQHPESQHFFRPRSEEHTSELQSLMRISYAVFCLKKQKKTQTSNKHNTEH